MLKDICNFIRDSIPSTITIELDLKEESLLVAADSNQLHQIILNLCTNAKDAMEESGGTLHLSAGPGKLEGGRKMVRLSVSDSGEGIPEDVKEKMFDPYFTTKAVGKGSGLGLAVVHGVVKSLHGEITVSSQPEEGTTFEILLPAAEREKKILPAKPEQVVHGNGEHILLIDDEEQITETVKELLEDLEYQVTACHSSPDALAAFKADPDRFDAVLTDQTMPQMTGLNLAKQLSGLRPDIPILLGTGYLEGVNPETAYQHGVTKLLHKPYEIGVLAAAFRQVLASR
jgi:CheY-like chemotaxis protein